MADEILQSNKPFKYTSRNPRTSYRQLKRGEIFLLEIEIEEEIWNAVRTLPKNAIIENVSWYHDGDNAEPEPILGTAETPKAVKGPHSNLWHSLCAKGILSNLELRHILDDPEGAGEVKRAMYKEFGVTSLSLLSPEAFKLWLKHHSLDGLITMVELAERGLETK